jgi:hypothetical protein
MKHTQPQVRVSDPYSYWRDDEERLERYVDVLTDAGWRMAGTFWTVKETGEIVALPHPYTSRQVVPSDEEAMTVLTQAYLNAPRTA